MPVTNIECQIARSQIGRYLAGEGFSAEAVRQLEGHIADCAVCKGFLQERKAALQAMLGGPRAVIEVDASRAAAPKNAPAAAPTKSTAKPAAEAVKGATFTRPMMLSLALAVVLIGMSAFSRGGAMGLLGPKMDALPAGPTASLPAVGTTGVVGERSGSSAVQGAAGAPAAVTPNPGGSNPAATTPATVAVPPVAKPPVATVPATSGQEPAPKTNPISAPVAALRTPPAATDPPVSKTPPAPESKPAAPKAETASVEPKPISTTPKAESKSAVAKPAPAAPRRSTPVRPKIVRRAIRRVRRPVATIRRPVRRPAPRRSTVRVYDAAGRPIG